MSCTAFEVPFLDRANAQISLSMIKLRKHGKD
jgi:hypothetical protein